MHKIKISVILLSYAKVSAGYEMKIILFVKIFLLLAIFSQQNEIDLSYNLQKILNYLDENIHMLEPSSIFGASLAEGLLIS